MSVYEIMKEVKAERQYQADRWANGDLNALDEVDDKNNGPMEFSGYIAHYAFRWFLGGFPPYSRDCLNSFRKHMIMVATLAVAAVRWVDRELERRS